MPRSIKTYCCVFDCLKNSKTDPDLSFFKIPVGDKKIREQWLRVIGREDLLDKQANYRVCSAHFKPQDIRQKLKRRLLKHNAVPSLNLPSADKEETQEQEQNYTTTLDTSSEVLTCQVKVDATTMTNRILLIDTSSQTEIEWPQRGIQAPQPVEIQLKKKRKAEHKEPKDPLAICKEEEETEESEMELFHRLCDKFLPKKLAKLVKAQTD